MKKIALILTVFLLSFSLAFAVVENLEVPPKQYTGNGVTTDFPITFDYSGESDLTVSFVNDSDGSIDAWTQDALGDQGYTIVNDEVIANTAPDGGRLVIDGETPLTQTLNLKNNRATPAELYESALDKGMLATRDVKAVLDRTMTAPATADPDVDYTAPEYEAGSYWQWHPTLKELRNAAISGSTTTVGTDVGDIVELIDDGSGAGVFPKDQLRIVDEDDMVSDSADLVPTQQSVKAYVDEASEPLGVVTKTDDYTILSTESGVLFILGDSTSADKTFKFPNVSSGDDGFIANILNGSNYEVTVKPFDSNEYMQDTGAGYGWTANKRGCFGAWRYNHSDTTWYPISTIGGGLWMIEGSKIWVPGTELTTSDIDNTTIEATATELTKRHLALAKNGIALSVTSDFYFASYNFNGVDEDIVIADSADWDIGASNTNDITIIVRPNHNLIGSAETYLSQVESATDEWFFRKDAADYLQFFFETSLGSSVSLDPGTDALSADVQYTIAVCKKGSAWGLYYGIGNVLTQIAFDNSWTVDPGFISALEIGRRSGADYFDGLLNDVFIAHQNRFNAAPVVGLTDTVTIPTNFNFVNGGN